MRMRTGLIFLLSFLLASCATGLKKPEVALAGIDLDFSGLSRKEQRLVLKLNVRNPNEMDLSVNALHFDLELDGKHFAKGDLESPAQIPGNGESLVEVVASGRYGRFFRAIWGKLKENDTGFIYRIRGYADLEGFGHIPFEREGNVPLQGLSRKK